MSRETLTKIAVGLGLLALLLALVPSAASAGSQASHDSAASWSAVPSSSLERPAPAPAGGDHAAQSLTVASAAAWAFPAASAPLSHVSLPPRVGLRIVQVTVLLR